MINFISTQQQNSHLFAYLFALSSLHLFCFIISSSLLLHPLAAISQVVVDDDFLDSDSDEEEEEEEEERLLVMVGKETEKVSDWSRVSV